MAGSSEADQRRRRSELGAATGASGRYKVLEEAAVGFGEAYSSRGRELEEVAAGSSEDPERGRGAQGGGGGIRRKQSRAK